MAGCTDSKPGEATIMRFFKTKCIYLATFGVMFSCVLWYAWNPGNHVTSKRPIGSKYLEVDVSTVFTGAGHVVHGRDTLSISGFNTRDVTLHFLDEYKNPCILEEHVKPAHLINDVEYSNNEYYKDKDFRALFETVHPTLIRDQGPCLRTPCRLRCWPYFMVIGVAEQQTMQLYNAVLKHPDVIAPLKETFNYWEKYRFGGACLNDYMDLYDNATGAIQQAHIKGSNMVHSTSRLITGEVNSIYMLTDPHWRNDSRNGDKTNPQFVLVKDLAGLLPNLKFIVILQDPVKHIYWHYHNAPYGRGQKSPQEFHERVVKTLSWWKLCTEQHGHTQRSCASGNPEKLDLFEKRDNSWWPKSQYAGTIRDGFYDLHLQDLMQSYPRDNILFLNGDTFETNQDHMLHNVFKFLDLKNYNSIVEEKHILMPKEVLEYEPMLPQTKQMLDKFFNKYDWLSYVNKIK